MHATFLSVILFQMMQILECVVVNLTIVYGILAYFRISIIGFSRLVSLLTVSLREHYGMVLIFSR